MGDGVLPLPPTLGRVVALDPFPVLAGGRSAAATVGQPFLVEATVFRDAPGDAAAEAVLVRPDGREHARARMTPVPDPSRVDRRSAVLVPDEQGRWTFCIETWSDPWQTWRARAAAKVPAGADVALELEEGARLLDRAAAVRDEAAEVSLLRRAAARLRGAAAAEGPDVAGRAAAAIEEVSRGPAGTVMSSAPLREGGAVYGPYPVRVDRVRAAYGSWYSFFPRSEGARRDAGGRWVSGDLATAARRLPAIAAMGFDVVYLPPIHPIGTSHRKGRNNSTAGAAPDDPGSPWAIGSEAGGHDAVHPDLGTLDDFDDFVAAATAAGLEVALDFALQCSPEHPWVRQHPSWFRTRADGTIAYAENPPKKYQDVYPVHFDEDPDGILDAAEEVLRHWMARGVRIFRVDNPHTKPVPFWERLLARVHATDPDVLFLSEAFTRPPMMRVLAEVGFQQSYTYFTWRHTPEELSGYVRELVDQPAMRPNFFANTHDILTAYLQDGGPPAFAIRATLASLLSPSWGIYSGFELFENRALRPGGEEYLDSEKYQFRPREWPAAGEAPDRTLIGYVTFLNRLRRAHPALQVLRGVEFHPADDPSVLAFSKRLGDDVLLVVCATDPHRPVETVVRWDLDRLGAPGTALEVVDLVTGAQHRWDAATYVRLDPLLQCAHVATPVAAADRAAARLGVVA